MVLERLTRYLEEAFGGEIQEVALGEIGALETQGMKDFGYGKPVLVRFRRDDVWEEAVLSVMKGDKYGHQFVWDRAANLMFQYATEGKLERHVQPLAMGYFDKEGEMIPLREPKEFFILHEKSTGEDYFRSLYRIQEEGLREEDEALAREFARWLGKIHQDKHDAPDLYLRRVRELIGGSECIFGLIDGYPYPYEAFLPERFIALEKRLIDWRWKLRSYTHRLAAVHGDFHPWNVLVRTADDFSVLDRSRGEWGEPADDLVAMACNYLLFGLLHEGHDEDNPFWHLHAVFWEEYLKTTGDDELLEVVAPFYVFRCLVVASPEWYPDHPRSLRGTLLRLMENLLEEKRFDPGALARYVSQAQSTSLRVV